MPNPSHTLLHYLRVAAGAWRREARDDGELLDRFAAGEEGAFVALLCRHGPLVWRACTLILGDGPDAEDAFQATFLALARQGSSLRRGPLAGWLHRVATRSALDVRDAARRRRGLERRLTALPTGEGTVDPERAELRAALVEELAQLPERLRVPLILRHLERKTLAEIARALTVSVRAVTKRLSRGEAMLRQRLTGRGFTGAAAALVAGAGAAAAQPPRRLVLDTMRAATGLRRGGSLIRGWLAALVCACGMATVGLAWHASLATPNPTAPPEASAGEGHSPGEAKVRVPLDGSGDPLPPGAVARVGSVRLRGGADGVAFLPDGKSFVAGGNGTIRVWDLASGRELRRLEGHPRGVQFLAFSPDTQLVAFYSWADDESIVRLWNPVSGREVIPKEYVRSMAPSGRPVVLCPGGRLAALQQEQPDRFCLRDVEIGVVLAKGKFDRPRANLRAAAWSPDGKRLALACAEGEEGRPEHAIRIWDAKTGLILQSMRGLGGAVQRLEYSPDGRLLAAADFGNKVHVWDTATCKELCCHDGDPDSPLAFSPDSRTLVTTSADHPREPVLRDLVTGKEVRNRGSSLSSASFSADGKVLLLGEGHRIRRWDVAKGKDFPGSDAMGEVVGRAVLSPDGRLLATSDVAGEVRLWDAATGQLRRSLGPVATRLPPLLAFSPHGLRLAAAPTCGLVGERAALQGSRPTIRVWEVSTGRQVSEIPVPPKAIATRICFPPPEGNTLAVAWQQPDGGQEISFYRQEGGRPEASFRVAGLGMTFSPDGRTLMTKLSPAESPREVIRLWDRKLGHALGSVEITCNPEGQLVYAGAEFALAFSPDGRTFVAADRTGRLALWETATGTEVWEGRGRFQAAPQSYVHDAAFSPDGRLIATAEPTGGVCLWDAATGQQVHRLAGHDPLGARGVAFSADGRRMVSWGQDGTALVWDTRRWGPARSQKPSTSAEIQALWEDLNDADSARAYRARMRLTGTPEETVTLLRARLRPVAFPDAARLERLLAELDSDQFAARERASAGLEALGESAEPALRRLLQRGPSAEARARMEKILAKILAKRRTDLRPARAVAVLEDLDSVESRRVLKALAGGLPGTELTEEARAALERLSRDRPR